jgi:hypothetical protein
MRIVIGAYFSNVPIPTGGTPVSPFYGVIKWARSIERCGYHCVLLSDAENNASTPERTCVKVEYDPAVSVYHNRFFAINNWLQATAANLTEVWVTDTPDVEMLNTPAPEPNKIYVCSEPHQNDNYPWIFDRVVKEIKDALPDYDDVVKPSSTLLNCGVIGGRAECLIPFMREYVEMVGRFAHPFTDTPIINYMGYRYGAEFGPHVTTPFKSYVRTTAWFKHK